MTTKTEPLFTHESGRSLARPKRELGVLESAGSIPAVLTKKNPHPDDKRRAWHAGLCSAPILPGGGSVRSTEGDRRSPTRKRNWLGARTASKAVRTRKGVGFETSLFLQAAILPTRAYKQFRKSHEDIGRQRPREQHPFRDQKHACVTRMTADYQTSPSPGGFQAMVYEAICPRFDSWLGDRRTSSQRGGTAPREAHNLEMPVRFRPLLPLAFVLADSRHEPPKLVGQVRLLTEAPRSSTRIEPTRK
jgi:hypothetical protein